MTSRIICVGELLLRLTAPGRELLLQSGRLDVHIGGAEANVAVALASLGHETAMVSAVPANRLGNAAREFLRRHAVDTTNVIERDGRMGLYFLSAGAGVRAAEIVYDREASSFARLEPGEIDWNAVVADAGHLHLSGITPALGPDSDDVAQAALAAAKASSVPVSFDGNYRETLWNRWDGNPRERLGRLVSGADIFFGNHRDISLLLGQDFPGGGPERRREAATAAFAAFPNLKLIASTARRVIDADRHAIAARIDTPDEAFQTEEAEIAGIVDRIGAGDAFAAGVLHALLSGEDPAVVARTGLALTLLKHSLPGDASLFAPADLEAFLSGALDVRR